MMAEGCQCGLCKREREIERLRSQLDTVTRPVPNMADYERMRAKAALYDAVDYACEHLPEGTHIEIGLEGGAGWLGLHGEGNRLGAGPVDGDESLADGIRRLVSEAREAAEEDACDD